MIHKKPTYKKSRVYRKYVVYCAFVAFGLVFWWMFGGPSSILTPNHTAEILREPSRMSTVGSFGDVQVVRRVDRLEKGENLNLALARNGLSQQESLLVTELLRPKVNLRSIRPGEVLIVEREHGPEDTNENEKAGGAFTAFELVRTDPSGLPIRYRLERKPGQAFKEFSLDRSDYELRIIETEVSVVEELYSGQISTSLYDGILQAGGDPGLVNRFSELFGWQIDFYRETQPGDSFQFVVERKISDGRSYGFGAVKAAEYTNGGKVYRGFYYASADGKFSGYFDENGISLEKSFFKSPMQLTRITSKYGQRFHPVLGKMKKHNGVDYGAPTGTPFWAVADGTILEARYSPTAGNMVRVKHNNGYTTEYFHASKIARGIRAGVKVRQKQILGYVGTTGRSTGPHLHFGMLQNKKYVNPSNQKIAMEIVLPKKEIGIYHKTISPLIAQFVQESSNRT